MLQKRGCAARKGRGCQLSGHRLRAPLLNRVPPHEEAASIVTGTSAGVDHGGCDRTATNSRGNQEATAAATSPRPARRPRGRRLNGLEWRDRTGGNWPLIRRRRPLHSRQHIAAGGRCSSHRPGRAGACPLHRP